MINLPKSIICKIVDYLDYKFIFKCNQMGSQEKLFKKLELRNVIINNVKKATGFFIHNSDKSKFKYVIKNKINLKLDSDKFLKYYLINKLVPDNRDNFIMNGEDVIVESYSDNIKKFLMPFLKKKVKTVKKFNRNLKIQNGFRYTGIPVSDDYFNISNLNTTCFLLCNRITKIFPVPIAKLITSYISFSYESNYDLYNTQLKRKQIVIDISLDIRRKILNSIFITFQNWGSKESSIIRVFCSDTKVKVHNPKYLELFIISLIMTHNYKEKKIHIILADFSKKMEKFVYNVLKKTFKPKFDLYKKVFDLEF